MLVQGTGWQHYLYSKIVGTVTMHHINQQGCFARHSVLRPHTASHWNLCRGDVDRGRRLHHSGYCSIAEVVWFLSWVLSF
jgi:hypothetical protein